MFLTWYEVETNSENIYPLMSDVLLLSSVITSPCFSFIPPKCWELAYALLRAMCVKSLFFYFNDFWKISSESLDAVALLAARTKTHFEKTVQGWKQF